MVFSVGKIVCSKLLTRNYGRRDVCDGTTPLLQHAFGQPLGVALPGFSELDDLSSDGVTEDRHRQCVAAPQEPSLIDSVRCGSVLDRLQDAAVVILAPGQCRDVRWWLETGSSK